jgi:MoxR-like ATPase
MDEKIRLDDDETIVEPRPVDVMRTQPMPIPRVRDDGQSGAVAVADLPLAAEPADLEPITAEPIAAESIAAEPVEIETITAEPIAAEPVEIETIAAEPARLEPIQPAPPVAAPPAPAPAIATRPPAPPAANPMAQAWDVLQRLRARMRAQILGRDEVIDLVLVALLADGHVLLEDFPGSGKTTLAKSLGLSIIDDLVEPHDAIAAFRRIQFTPDLLPSDVTGVSVFDAATSGFHFRHGPIFAHVVLADEINRTSPKVQAAMLEAMAEKQVTVDNVTYPLDDLFFVIATQNPLDLAGTYPLPVAQLDRFLFKIRMDHIHRDAELAVLESWRDRRDLERGDLPKVTRSEVLAARRAIDDGVAISRAVKECLVDLTQAIRDDERVAQGNSTRSLVLLLPALQAMALLHGRDYVSAEDIVALAPRVLGHRVELAPGLADLSPVLNDALGKAVEKLSRGTLRRS